MATGYISANNGEMSDHRGISPTRHMHNGNYTDVLSVSDNMSRHRETYPEFADLDRKRDEEALIQGRSLSVAERYVAPKHPTRHKKEDKWDRELV